MKSLLLHGDFRWAWLAGLSTLTASWVLTIALPAVLYLQTGSVSAGGLLVALQLLPGLVLGVPAGVWIDRLDRRNVMIAGGILRCGLGGVLLMAAQSDSVVLLYVVGFLGAIVGEFVRLAENALLPTLVDRALLPQANALNVLNNNLAGVIGPSVAGLLLASLGLAAVAATVMVLALISAFLLLRVTARGRPAPEPRIDTAIGRSALAGFIAEMRSGLAIVHASPRLRIIFGIAMVIAIANATFDTVFTPWVIEIFDRGEEALGLLRSAQGVGGIVGAIAVGWLGHRLTSARQLSVSLVASGVIGIVFVSYPFFLPGLLVGLVLQAADGFPIAASNSGAQTLLVTSTRDAQRGRIFGALGSVMALSAIVMSLLAGVLADLVGMTQVLLITGLASLVAGVLVLRFERGGTFASDDE